MPREPHKMKLIKRLFYIFPCKQRWQFAGLFLLQLIETLLDFFGVSLILPFVNVLVNADALRGAGWYGMVSRLIGADDTASILLFITLLMIAVYIVKNIFILFSICRMKQRDIGNNLSQTCNSITCFKPLLNQYEPLTPKSVRVYGFKERLVQVKVTQVL